MSGDIPNPLRTGDYTLSRASYFGDVGSTNPNNQPVLTLEHRASADVTVLGIGDLPYAHYASFTIENKDTLDLALGGGRLSPYGPGIATVDLKHRARLTGDFKTSLDGNLHIHGTHGSRLVDYSGTMLGGSAIIQADIKGHGSVTVSSDGPVGGASLELDGQVGRGESVDLVVGSVLLDKPAQFLGTIDWEPLMPVTAVTLQGVTADSYAITNDHLHLFRGCHEILDLKFAVNSGVPEPMVFQGSQGVILSDITVNGAVPVPLHDPM